MARKLTNSEKFLVAMLLVAVLAVGYYYLFWNNINKKIESEKEEIATLQIMHDIYQRKINGLAELKVKLSEMENLPSYVDKFYSFNENQETYLNFLHKLVTDNKLTLESIVFSESEAKMPVSSSEETDKNNASDGLQTPSPTASENIDSPSLSFIVTSAVMSFNVDYNALDRLLNVLSTIETYEKMVLVSNLSLSVTEADSKKSYSCNADILFVSLAAPLDADSEQGAIQ
jgi:hypothetical protein